MKITTKIKRTISWILIILSLPFLSMSIIDFCNTKDFIDIIIFLIFFIPFLIGSKCLAKTKRQKHADLSVKRECDTTKVVIPLSEESTTSQVFSLSGENGFSTNIQQYLPSQSAETIHVESTIAKPKPDKDIIFPDWYVSISFGKSTSDNYMKAVALAKVAPQYLEQVNDGKILHQAVYSSKPSEYLAFVMLYELVGTWKSSFVIINGQLIDRKVIGQLNYCYGDKCRSGNPDFCYGASYMTDNPFGCHRLQISACNNPWWSYYKQSGPKWILDKEALLQRINSYSAVYSMCPVFDYDRIISVLNELPYSLSDKQYKKLLQEKHQSIYLTL